MTAKATTGITNLYLYNRFVQDVNDDATSNISDTETLRYIIDQTNDLIGKKCARNFGTDTYKEWIETQGESYVVAHNYPITNVKLLSLNGVDLYTVQGTGFQVATTSSNSTSTVLSSIDTTGTDVETILPYSTYANVNSIVTAINLVSGWEAEVLSDRGDALTQLIRPTDSRWCLDEKAYERGPYLGSDARVSYDSDAIIDFGANYFGDWDYNCGRWVFVWYTAGYTLPNCDDAGGTETVAGNVPEGLTLIANQIIKDVMEQEGEDTNMKSEKIGDYTYSRDATIDCIDRRWKSLSLYSRKSV